MHYWMSIHPEGYAVHRRAKLNGSVMIARVTLFDEIVWC